MATYKYLPTPLHMGEGGKQLIKSYFGWSPYKLGVYLVLFRISLHYIKFYRTKKISFLFKILDEFMQPIKYSLHI